MIISEKITHDVRPRRGLPAVRLHGARHLRVPAAGKAEALGGAGSQSPVLGSKGKPGDRVCYTESCVIYTCICRAYTANI